MSSIEPAAGPAPPVNEWEPFGVAASTKGRTIVALWFAALLAPWIVIAAVTGGYLRWAALIVAALQVAWIVSQRRRLLSGSMPARPEDHSRFVNLATGLAEDLRMEAPRLYVSRHAGANAFVVPGAVVVTEDLLATYTRTELEAAIAHCLVRVRDGGLAWGVASAAAGGLAGAIPPVDAHLDARAAAVTRYPPALASAIRKASPARGRTAQLWFVANGPSHLPAEMRAAELLDL